MTNSFDAQNVNGGSIGGHGFDRDETVCAGTRDWLGGDIAARRSDRPEPDPDLLLARVIERDIIPRLLLAHREPTGRPARAAEPVRLDYDCHAFANLALIGTARDLIGEVEAMIDRGVGLNRVYLDVLAPAARRLGDMWLDDECSFAEVTLGLTRLHQVLRDIGHRHGGETVRPGPKRRAYLVPVPGEIHTFGLAIVEEFFRQSGWETICDQAASAAAILQQLKTEKIDILGFTLGSEQFLEPLCDLIAKARKLSINPDLEILVGGSFLDTHPELASQIGGATLITEGINAVKAAEQLLSRMPQTVTIQ